MGFLSRLFGRVQEEPLARPEPPPPPEPEEASAPAPPAEPEVLAEPEASAEPEEARDGPAEVAPEAAEPDVGAGLVPPAEPEEAPAEPEGVASLAPPVREPARAALPRAFPPTATVKPEPEPEPDPDPGLPIELALTLDEVTAALRGAGSDGIRIGFISREYLRAPVEERAAARRKLVGVLTEQLRARGLLAECGTFELREEPTLAKTRGGGR